MNRTTLIGVGLAVLAGLTALVVVKAKEDAKIGTSETTAADLPEIKATDAIDKISITNADKGEVVLEKKGDKWELTKPLTAPANQTNVKSLLDNLKELKTKEVILSNPTEEQKKDYSFEPAKEVHVVAWQGADKKVDATFGKSGARGQMAMVEGKPGIYSVSGYSSYLYGRETKGWRDTDIFKFDDQNAIQMAVDSPKGKFSFTKGESWAGTINGKPIDHFDEDKVKDALRALKTLTAENFGDGKPASETGLDEPEGKITVELKDHAGTYTLKVGKVATGTSRYAMKDGSDTIFIIPQYSADWALADVSKFQKTGDAGAGAPGGEKKEPPKKDAPKKEAPKKEAPKALPKK